MIFPLFPLESRAVIIYSSYISSNLRYFLYFVVLSIRRIVLAMNHARCIYKREDFSFCGDRIKRRRRSISKVVLPLISYSFIDEFRR